MHDQDQSLWAKPENFRETGSLTTAAHIASDKWFRYPDQLTVGHFQFGFSYSTNSENIEMISYIWHFIHVRESINGFSISCQN